MACMFVHRLPSPGKKLLWFSYRVDALSLQELWVQTWKIMKDETEEKEPAKARVQTIQPSPDVASSVTCYKCKGPNHFARDCVQRHEMACVHCYRCNKISHLVRDCLGNMSEDETSTKDYSPRQGVNVALPTVTVSVDRASCLAILDSGCLFSITQFCWVWSKQDMKVFTVTKVTQACYRSRTGNAAKINTLVMQKKPLDYNLLLGINTIKCCGQYLYHVLDALSLRRCSLSVQALHVKEAYFTVRHDVGERVQVAACGCSPEKVENRRFRKSSPWTPEYGVWKWASDIVGHWLAAAL